MLIAPRHLPLIKIFGPAFSEAADPAAPRSALSNCRIPLAGLRRGLASQCRTVDQVVVLPDGADAKSWYVSLSRAREAMHVYTRKKAALRESVMYPGERTSIWEIVQALRRSKAQSRNQLIPGLWAAQQKEMERGIRLER